MAHTLPLFSYAGLKAGADLSARQFYAVKLDSSGDVVLCSAVTDQPIGILQNNPKSGMEAHVMAVGISKVSSDAALAINDRIGTSSDGQLVAKTIGTDITHYVIGRVLIASTAANGIATATIEALNPHRAT